MSGKILARASALSLAVILAACGGGDDSAPLAGPAGGSAGGGTGGTNAEGGSGAETEVVLALGTGSGDSFQNGAINATATNLSSGGETRLSFNVVDSSNGNSIYSASATSVTLTSQCTTAILDGPISTSSGAISTTYEAGCSGKDVITARLENGATASVTVDVAPQEIGSLEFVSVSPQTIAISGSSDSTRGNVAEVVFRITDKSGKPVNDPDQEVGFALSTALGGIALTNSSAKPNENGEVKTRVNAGSVATVVSVTATTEVDGVIIQTTSDPISVSASVPDQDSFSISVQDNFLPNARNYDGIEVNLTIRAADRNNNLIGDTIVGFVTSAGAIQNECTLQEGGCSVIWVSQDPRSPDDGRVAILARSTGEESFRDLNSDGVYDADTDQFDPVIHDRPEAFLDRNRSETRDSNEEWFDYNSNGTYDVGDGVYNGLACTQSAEDAGDCTNQVKEIFEIAHIFPASDNLAFSITNTEPVSLPATICLQIAGEFQDNSGATIQGPPPGDTEVSFSTDNGTFVGPSSFNTTTAYTESPVTECVELKADDTPDSGTLSVEVTPPAPSSKAYFLSVDIDD